MVISIGYLLWGVALAALLLAWRRTAQDLPATPWRWVIWSALLVLAAGLLFRPHEDIFGGEDPGSYLNSGVTYARQKTLFYTDPLLAQVPTADRPVFLCGHSGYGKTKDACLWVRDLPTARIGPWFQPAYPLMMSAVALVAPPRLVLYVAPLLGLLTALALACLAARLIRRPWAGAAAFLFYVLNPIVAWNARSPRAELGAGLFVILGWALLLAAWDRRAWQRWPDTVLGLLCVGLAPLFHSTAWFAALPTFALLAVAAMRGRKDFLLVIPLALVGVAAYLAQVRLATDCYGLWRFVEPILAHPLLPALLLAAGAVPTIAVSFRAARRATAPVIAVLPAPLWRRLVPAVITVAVIVAATLTRDTGGRLPFLPYASVNYLALADFHGLIQLTSRLVALTALCGWILLIVRPAPAVPGKAFFLAALFPAIMLTGWMNNYMMETRRLVAFTAPLLAICLAALVTAVAQLRIPGRRVAGALLAAGLLAAGIHGRGVLYRQTDYRGFYRFLKPLAGTIRESNGILLGEYSRIAAPFEHFFGIPTLSLDNERRSDYRTAERAWEAIMRAHPNQPAYFLTPFQPPCSDRFTFDLVRTSQYAHSRLETGRRQVPSKTRPWSVDLTLYRVRLHDDPGARKPAFPYLRRPDAGNMGLWSFSQLRTDTPTVDTLALGNGTNAEIALPPAVNGTPCRRLLVLSLATDLGVPAVPGIALAPAGASWTAQSHDLGSGWCASDIILGTGTEASSLRLSAPAPLLVADVLLITTNGSIRAPGLFEGRTVQRAPLPPFTSRWTRATAGVVLPVPQATGGLLLAFLTGPGVPEGAEVTIGQGNPGGHLPAPVASGIWRWYAWPMRSVPASDYAWHTIHTIPSWDPHLDNFPHDLGVRVGALAVIKNAVSEPSR